MANPVKRRFLNELAGRFGTLKKLSDSQSLFDLSDCGLRVYIRYSKRHRKATTFYGLRQCDLRALEGHPAAIAFLWDEQDEPLFLPYAEFEDVFGVLRPASDGQFKVQVQLREDGAEFYIPTAGKFNVESYVGWQSLSVLVKDDYERTPQLTHPQVQTLLGTIGSVKGYGVWIPVNDRSALDWSIAPEFLCPSSFPLQFGSLSLVAGEIDVIWFERGSGLARAFFEIEHSTPIYSGLLRLNDVHISIPDLRATFGIVSNEARRELFVRQVNRPTFRSSGLAEACAFLEYKNVYDWFRKLVRKD